VDESIKNPSRKKRIKVLMKKTQKMKGEQIKDRMLLLFELERELDDKYIYKGNKCNKVFA